MERARVLQQVLDGLPSGGRVVDVAPGSGAFAIAVAAMAPNADVVAVDADPEALRLVQRKRGADRVTWLGGRADALPLPDASADRVVVHSVDAWRAAQREADRVLRPGGRVLLAARP